MALEAGCVEGRIDVGHDLNEGISPEQCMRNITRDTISLENQERVVINPSRGGSSIDSDGIFQEELKLVQEGFDVVILAAIGNLDDETNTLDITSATTGVCEQGFGNGEISRETSELFVTADFGGIPSVTDVEIDLVATDPTCTKLYSDVFRYEVTSEDYGFENGYYEVEEK